MSFDKLPEGGTLKPSPFTYTVPQEQVDAYYQLIKLSPLAPKTYENLHEDTLAYGVTHKWMTAAKEHWLSSYDWRQREEKINSFPHFKTKVVDDDGYEFDMHFVALFSNDPKAVPVVFLHGWPGSFLEFLGILDLLRNKYTPDTLPYHVVAPSLPGYGLSSGPPLDKDFVTEDIARVVDKLMVGLGFGSGYVGQGGDIGAYTCRPLSTHPSCKAIHLNFSWMPDRDDVPDSELNDAERAGVRQSNRFAAHQSAYALEHGTRPSTIGMALATSPLALLAWIGEKFVTWSDTTPALDDILDSISLYWFTECFSTSLYPYRQFHNSTKEAYSIHADPKYFIDILGYSFFPYELAPMPRAWVAKTGNLVWAKQHTEGGHFAALEKPHLLLEDVEDYIKQIWK